MKKITLLIFLLVTTLGFSQTQVTFKVDMTNYVGLGTTSTVNLNGTFNGWCGACNPMVREGSTNIWSVTLPITPGTIEYKFTVDGWNAQENLTSGTSCTITANGFTNRSLVVGSTAITVPTVCWQSCNACNVTPPNTNVTFKVDMSNYVGLTPTDVVYVAGTFNGWSGNANPLTREGTTNVWSVVLPIPQSTIEYKFQINNWAANESLTAGTSCTVTANGFTNRSLVVGSTAIVNPVVCWASCASCTAPSLPIDFESSTVTYTFADFDGGVGTKIANPNSGGINTSANVGRIVKGAGQPWAGSYLTLAAPINFSVNKIFKVKVYSPRVGAKLNLKVEGAVGVTPFEREVIGTVANAWEEMTFDYQAVSTTNVYTKLVFMFDLGTVGDGSANFTFLIDDIRLIAPTGPVLTQMNLPVTFDDSTVNYNLNSFGGTASSIIVDPTLSTNKVGKVIKNAPETWAGTTLGVGAGTTETGFSSAIPFTTTERRMNVRVWSPTAGTPVRLKVEVAGQNTQSVETQTLTTVANGWQTMEFNFNNQATGTAAFNPAFAYNKASIFFNFGIAGSGQIYYFDDMKFGAAALGVNSFNSSNIRMYPNPTSSVFTIEANELIENVTLFNVLGQQVLAKTSNSTSVTLDVANLQTGVYVVKTMIGGVASTSRLVKN